MSGPDPGPSAATPVWALVSASAAAGNPGVGRARPERRVVLGDLTNVMVGGGGGRFVPTDAEKELDDARKLKPSQADIGLLNKRLMEDKLLRERVESEKSKLQSRVHELELQLASYGTQLDGNSHGSCCVNMSQQIADLEMQPLTNLNNDGHATLVKETAGTGTELAAVSKEKDSPRENHTMLTEQEHRDGDHRSLTEMLSDQGQMDVIREMERTIDQMYEIITQQCTKLNKMNERLSIEREKVTSLEREQDQLRLQLGHGDHSVSNTKVPHMVHTLAVDGEAQPEVQKTSEWLQALEELKGQVGSQKKQPVLIEICDDGETSMWCDDDKKPSNPCSTGEPGIESWFFRGNKLMLSSGMKEHLRKICGYVPPEMPFYLYQMNKSSLENKGRMRLSARYTSVHLLSCLHRRKGCVQFEVDGEECGIVRMNLLRDGRASLSSGWEGVVEAKGLKVGDICAFHFKVSNGDLKLSVHVFHVARCLMSLR